MKKLREIIALLVYGAHKIRLAPAPDRIVLEGKLAGIYMGYQHQGGGVFTLPLVGLSDRRTTEQRADNAESVAFRLTLELNSIRAKSMDVSEAKSKREIIAAANSLVDYINDWDMSEGAE